MDRLTFADGQALVELFRDSGLKQQQFCEAQGIPVHRLKYWCRRVEARSATAKATEQMGFIEMTSRCTVSAVGTGAVTITTPNGWRIESRASLPAVLQAVAAAGC